MNRAAFAEFGEALSSRQAQLQAEVHAHRARLTEPAAATGNTFIAGSEGAIADADDEMEVTLLRRSLGELDEVNAALARLAAGSYGRCLTCQAPIGTARLNVLPEARLCMRCQRAADAGGAAAAAGLGRSAGGAKTV